MMDIKELVERVREIDADAADYLEGDGKLLSECSDEDVCEYGLWGLFNFSETLQGRKYWYKIASTLDKDKP